MNRLIIFSLLSLVFTYSSGQENTSGCTLNIPQIVTLQNCGDTVKRDYEFRITSTCPVRKYAIKIYNRWGTVVYESDDITKPWDASKAPIGSYLYSIDGVYENKEVFSRNGYFNIIK